MESLRAPMISIRHFTVSLIEQRRRAVRSHKVGDQVEVEWENIGWFLVLMPGNISFYVGEEKPDSIKESDTVELSLKVVSHG